MVSIHAPVKGATFCGFWMMPRVICFNPRTREGCDLVVDALEHLLVVSIHAPVKGATGFGTIDTQLKSLFQSTHP